MDSGVSQTADRRALLAGLGGLAAGVFLAGSRGAHAGPLDPPAGPVGSTGLTLDDLAARASRAGGIAEPRRPLPDPSGNVIIVESGSYYLTRNTDAAGLTIGAADVTLDLCGHTLAGSPGGYVVRTSPGCERLVIRNGRLDGRENACQYGVRSESDVQITLEDLEIIGASAADATSFGVSCTLGTLLARRVSVASFFNGFNAPAGLLEDCRTDVPRGIVMTTGPSIVRRCVVRNASSLAGISVPPSSAVVECQVVQAGSIPGIFAGTGSLVDQCVVSGGRPGIRAVDQCLIVRSLVRGSQGVGIDAGAFARVADCAVNSTAAVVGGDPGIGVRCSQRLRLERSIISGNAGSGVRVTGFDAAISDCSIVFNGAVGVQCVGPATIDRCHLANNNGGILCDALTRVDHCHLDFNGPYGIWATSTTIGGTFVTDCDITRHTNGVDIRTATGSGVFRSRFAGNSNDIITPGGNFALIVFGPAAAAAATNPNINIAL